MLSHLQTNTSHFPPIKQLACFIIIYLTATILYFSFFFKSSTTYPRLPFLHCLHVTHHHTLYTTPFTSILTYFSNLAFLVIMSPHHTTKYQRATAKQLPTKNNHPILGAIYWLSPKLQTRLIKSTSSRPHQGPAKGQTQRDS